jgi:hypothetical protein
MAHVYNPTYSKAEIGKVAVPGHSGEKVSKIPFQPTSWVWWDTVVMKESYRIVGQARPSRKPCLKHN